MPWKGTKTRYQGVFARHQTHCALNGGGRCNCRPSYYGACYDLARKRYVKTKRMPTAEAARNARTDLARMLEQGEAPIVNAVRLTDARERFLAAAQDGRALNKHGHRYKPRTIGNLEDSLRLHVEPVLGNRRLSDIRRGTSRRSSTSSRRACPEAASARSSTRSGRCTAGRRTAI